MSHLPTLLKKHETLAREMMRLEGELAAVRAEILATGRGAASKTTRPRATKTRAEAVEVVRETVRVLRDAGAPLPRREIAARLGLKPWVATYRLDKAVDLRFVEKVGGGLYQVTNVVPAF
jgi:hypothetical protein